jgi:hypothetical protein
MLPSKTKALTALALSLTLAASTAQAWDCNADCDQASRTYFRCPTFKNPQRRCPMTDHFTRSACLVQKAASCKLWQSAVDFASDKVKPHLVGEFNTNTWQAAVEEGTQDAYMAKCELAGISAMAGLGSYLGGPWGASLSGAIGVFASFQICRQSTRW